MISKFIFNNQYLFDELPKYDKNLLTGAMKTRNYRKNEPIFTDGTKPDQEVFISLSRIDLANMVGTARETLARIINDFKQEKLIRSEGRKIQIINFKELIHIANFY